MEQVVSNEHLQRAAYLKRILAAYRENEELIRLGAYARGSDADVDEALEKMSAIQSFLYQNLRESSTLEHTLKSLSAMTK